MVFNLMNKFIKGILSNEIFLDVIYNFGSFYNNSDYEDQMFKFINNNVDLKVSFISKNTDWLFITDNGDCYGTLDKFVVKVDSEGQFSYVCNGFENLAQYLLKDNLNLSMAEYYCKQKNTTVDQVLNNYKKLLGKYSLTSKLIINEQEFEDYLKNNGV